MTGIDWIIDLEISLIKALGWSLRDIDESNAENLLLLVYRMTSGKGEAKAKKKKVFADQAGWL